MRAGFWVFLISLLSPPALARVIQITGVQTPKVPYEFKHVTGVTLQGPGVIDCSKIAPDHACVKFSNSRQILIQNITIKNAALYNVMVVQSDGFTLKNAEVAFAGKTNVLTADTKNILITDSYLHDAKKEHNLYLSQSGKNWTILGSRFIHSGKNAMQLNAVPGGASGIRVEGNTFSGAANAGVNLAGISQGMFRNNQLSDNALQGFAAFDDGDPRYPCRDLTFIGNKIQMPPGARACFNFSAPKNAGLKLTENTCTGAKLLDAKWGLIGDSK